MSRMTDEELLRELACTDGGCRVLSLAGLKSRGMVTNGGCKCFRQDFYPGPMWIKIQKITQLVERINSDRLKALQKRVNELEEIIRTDPDYAPWAKLAAAEARVAELEKTRDDYLDLINHARNISKELRAADERIEKARGLIPGWLEGDFDLPDYTRGKMDGRHDCAKQLMEALGD